jgi:hypothetical protein
MVALHAGSFCSSFLFPPGADFFDPTLFSPIAQAAYSITAQDQLRPILACLLHAKPAVYRILVLNPFFSLAGVLIPKTDQQAVR